MLCLPVCMNICERVYPLIQFLFKMNAIHILTQNTNVKTMQILIITNYTRGIIISLKLAYHIGLD